MMIDGFLDSFDELKYASIHNQFIDEINPVDHVTYPLISRDIPPNVESELTTKLGTLSGRPIQNPIIFMRRSPEGVPVPHQVHSDNSMGAFSLMLYINGGHTGLVRHKQTGIAFAPEGKDWLDVVLGDSNNADAWATTEFLGGEPNRAAIFDAARLHRAEPVGGFGSGADSRVILTCFFS